MQWWREQEDVVVVAPSSQRARGTGRVVALWSHLTHVIDSRTVLDDVSGRLEEGGFHAVMGPTGSGKSTLLSLVAGDAGRPTRGAVEVRGRVAYAPQTDFLLPYVTVRETLDFAAHLRLDRSDDRWSTAKRREARVSLLIFRVGLCVVEGALVGSAERRGISGGERKRLALATELLVAPEVLIADEPTSGLDSGAAFRMTELLCDLGRSERTAVLASIHQPSSRIFALFGDLTVLLPGTGAPLYVGPAAEAVLDLELRLRTRVPPMTSAPEFLLDVASLETPPPPPHSTDGTHRTGGNHQNNKKPPPRRPWANNKTNVGASSEELPPFSQQVVVLWTRAWRSNMRSPETTVAALGRSIVTGLLVGALYSHVGNGQRGVTDRAGALFFVLVNQAFSAMTSIRVFIDERAVFEHERRRGAYGTTAYFLTKTLAEVPTQVALALLFTTVAYALVGLRRDLDAFAAHAAILVLATLVAESLILWIGALAPNAKVAVVLAPITLSLSMLLGGFLVAIDSLPPAIAPLQNLSLFRHAFAALLKIEFTGLDFTCSPADLKALAEQILAAGAPRRVVNRLNLPCPTPDGQTYLTRVLGPKRALDPVRYTDLPALLGLFVGFRLLAFYALLNRGRLRPTSPANKKRD